MRLFTKYLLLTYAISWTCFISVAVLSHVTSTLPPGSVVRQILAFLGVITPSLVALWLTAQSGTPGELQRLLGKIGKWKVNIKWYLFAVTFMVFVKLGVALIYKLTTGFWPEFGRTPWYLMIMAIVFTSWVQAGEEIGWRGFALPRLTQKFSLPMSTLILGVIWASWHLPLFFVRGADTFKQSFPLYLIQVTAVSVVLGWLYWRTQGSLLLVMLMHAAINNTKDIVPSGVRGADNPFALSTSLAGWLTVLLLWAFATYCLMRMRAVKFLE
jgi:uncharacterized protein